MENISLSLRLQDALKVLVKKSKIDINPYDLIAEFQQSKEKNVNSKLINVFSALAKSDELASAIYKNNFLKDIQSDAPILCLKRFLDTYDRQTRATSTANVTKRKHRSAPIEPSASLILNQVPENISVAEVTPNHFPEIMEKVKKAATDGLSRSAQLSTIQDLDGNATIEMLIALESSRPFFRKYFNKEAHGNALNTSPIQSCAALPIANQEDLIVDDLLYCLTASPGNYITPIFTPESEKGFASIKFKISSQVDITLSNIAQEILPLASNYSIVQKFTQLAGEMDNGVIQAFCEAMQTILDGYCMSIIQLETEKSNNALSLHKLLHLLRPAMQMMEILVEIVNKLVQSDLTPGKVLSLLYDEITLQTGNKKSQSILIELTERASVPYLEILELWILKGVIIDAYDQFFVIDHGSQMVNKQLQNDPDTARYWESRYTIHQDRIPRFLENDADIILRTGKYLNVIRQCGKQISPPPGLNKLEFSPTNNAHSIFIKNAYHNASKILLELLVNENNLMAHISSVKRYFLLQQGDLITQFMDASEEELSNNVDKVAPVRLDNLLQLIVRLSSAKHDPCLEHLHCDIFPMDLAKQMSKIHIVGAHYDDITMDGCEGGTQNIDLTGLECFVFKYNVQWPVSIVLNQWALSQYQMLFRLLFYCKHVERQLCKAWIENSGISKNRSEVKDLWRCAFSLRQRMLNAIQHLEYYMMIEVIEPNWNIFTDKMKSVKNIDEVISIHQDFLHISLQNCMLNNSELLRGVINMCKVSLKFCKFIENQIGVKYSDQWQKTIDNFTNEFVSYTVDLLQGINNLSAESGIGIKLISLVSRINFNGFYNKEIGQAKTA